MTTLEVLTAARELIADPGRWTQRAGARDAYGCPVPADWSGACQWCASGAVWAAIYASKESYDDAAVLAIFAPLNREAANNLLAFNDTEGHAEVLAAFDRAIEAERGAIRAREEGAAREE